MWRLPRPGYDADHESFRDSVRRFFAAEVVPQLDTWRFDGQPSADFFCSAGEQGFLGTTVPEMYDGGGADDPRFVRVLVDEAMAVGAAGLALVLARHSGVCASAMLRLPESDKRSAWLAGLATGSALAVPLTLNADLVAEGVPGAALADLFVISVPAGGVIVLPRDLVQVDPVVGSLGGREAAIADVRLDVSVLTGSPAVPDGQIQRDLDLWDAVVAVAGARAALELTLSYVAERKVFGRPVAEFENTRFRLAEIAAEIEAAEAFTDSCVSALGQELLEPATAAAARLIAERVHDHATDQGMQFHGGYGYMREYPISHAFGDARFLRLSAASNDPRESLAAALNL